MTANGSGHSTDGYDELVRVVAELKVSLDAIVKTQESIKGDLRKIAPRLDTLTASVDECGRLVHHQAGVIQALTNETAEVSQARIAFEKALEHFKIDATKRALEFERTQREFGLALELVEGRVRQMRDDMADAIAAANEEASGVKTRM
jgi:hypothetical protein